MAQGDHGRIAISLKASLCTDNPTGTDIYQPGNPEANHVTQTGIERQGGLTNLYENETDLGATDYSAIATQDGGQLYVKTSTHEAYFRDPTGLVTDLGNVGSCSIYQRGILAGYIDAAWTATGTILALKRNGTTLTVYELNASTLAVINSRSLTFAGLVTTSIFACFFVKYVDMAYADSQEFVVTYFTGLGTDKILKEAGLTLTTVQNGGAQATFAWRFTGANRYVYGRQGWAGTFNIGDILSGGAGATTWADVRWGVIDRFVGTTDSRIIGTFTPAKNAANTYSGYITAGFDGAGTYSATRSYKGVALAAVVATNTVWASGPGWSESCYTRSDTGTNIYNYIATPMSHTSATYYDAAQSQTSTLMSGYGKLTDIDGNHNSLTSLRMVMLPTPLAQVGSDTAIPSFLSVGPITAATTYDCLGVPLTIVGDIDALYLPHVVDDNSTYTRTIYRDSSGVLHYVDIRANVAHAINKVSDTVYQINTVSPIHTVDTEAKAMYLGAHDYNGRLRFDGTGAPSATTKLIASNLSSVYANSIDPGAKLATVTGLPTDYVPYAIDAPSFWSGPAPWYCRAYVSGTYANSYVTTSTAALIIEYSAWGTLFVNDTRLPIPMGFPFGDRVCLADTVTLFTGVGVIGSSDVDYGYEGYEIGNAINGLFDSFVLYGQRYLFDGTSVWSANFSGPISTGRSFMSAGDGVSFIAVTPNVAYFLSAYDNSVYAYDGGRSFSKTHRLNDVETILDGAYSVKENSLLLQTANTFIAIRDGVISSWPKTAAQIATATSLYSTDIGVVVMGKITGGNVGYWTYSFNGPGAGTRPVVPLDFQSAYFGPGSDILMSNVFFDVTLYSPSRAAALITITSPWLDADGANMQTEHLQLDPVDWSSLGLYRFRIKPTDQKVIAAGVGVSCATKVVLTEAVMDWIEDVAAIPANDRSV